MVTVLDNPTIIKEIDSATCSAIWLKPQIIVETQ